MKRVISIIFIIAIITVSLTSCKSFPEQEAKTVRKVALITDAGGISGNAVNQTAYDSMVAFCKEFTVKYNYFKPATDTKNDRVKMIDKAVSDGYNVIIVIGPQFSDALVTSIAGYPDVMFIAVDINKGDILNEALPYFDIEYDGIPENWDLSKYLVTDNLYCVSFKTEQSGFLAGYSAVKLGYENFGFIAENSLKKNTLYGYGFLQGIDAAAKELNIKATVNCAYIDNSYSEITIKELADEWYKSGTEAIMIAGESIYKPIGKSAAINGGKLIGCESDQAEKFDKEFGENITVISAMVGIQQAVYYTLGYSVGKDKWDDYKGKIEIKGIESPDNIRLNYVTVSSDTTQWNDELFNKDDFIALVAAIYNKEYTVSDSTVNKPELTNTTVTYFENNG